MVVKKWSYLLIILFIISPAQNTYCEDTYKIENINFIPPRYYVGDEVELKIKINIPETMSLAIPEEKKETPWIEITSVQILPYRLLNGRKTHDVSIFFKSFKTGALTLPMIILGDIELTNLEIHTSSIFEDNKDAVFAPSRGQLALPDTWVKLILILLILLLIPVFTIIISKYVLKGILKKGNSIRIQHPYHKLIRQLKKLKKQIKNMDFRLFYISLSDILKNYLQRRLSIPALTSTTREISYLSRYNLLERELSNEILKILSLSDFVKFGGRTSSEEEMNEVIRKIIFIVNSIEEEKKSVEP
ncbi:MAG: hypothetical protein JXJ04_09110 [Spirochaetales bacterium]|nr:hypothetical protein [Spirochaetales bacterium]